MHCLKIKLCLQYDIMQSKSDDLHKNLDYSFRGIKIGYTPEVLTGIFMTSY